MSAMTTQSTKKPAKVNLATDHQSVAIAINRRQFLTGLFLTCVIIIFGLIVADWVLNYAHGIESSAIRRLFNITREDGLASFVAVTLTLLAALTMWALWLLSRANGEARSVKIGWAVLAGMFTYLAVDDGAMIHERLGTALGNASAGGGWLVNFPSYYWQIIFVPILVVFGVYFLYFLFRRLDSPKKRWAIVVALGCLGLAIVLDFFEGLEPGSGLNIYTAIANSFDFADYARHTFGQTEYDTLLHFSKSLEESLEMLAMSLIWVTTLAHLLARYPNITFRSS